MQRMKAKAAVVQLQRSSTNAQVDFLEKALDAGQLSSDRLRRDIEAKARAEMAKGVRKLSKGTILPSVSDLLREYYSSPDFRHLADRVGLDEAWFKKLAETVLAERVAGG